LELLIAVDQKMNIDKKQDEIDLQVNLLLLKFLP